MQSGNSYNNKYKNEVVRCRDGTNCRYKKALRGELLHALNPHSAFLLTLGAHAQEGYGTCLVCLSVCLSVCYHSSGDLVRFNARSKVRGGFL